VVRFFQKKIAKRGVEIGEGKRVVGVQASTAAKVCPHAGTSQD
jgi:hypothetical protein